MSRNLDLSEEERLAGVLMRRWDNRTLIRFNYLDDIKRHANGKYERFVCEVE